jgi:TM2 domain-containing membrane protein YozV
MSKEDYERIIAAEAVVANEKKSTALAYVFAIFLGGAGAHNFYLGRPWRGLLNLLLLVLCFLPQIGILFLIINGVLVIWDLFMIPSIIGEQVEGIRRRFLRPSDTVAKQVLQPETQAEPADGMNPALWALLALIVISLGASILGARDRQTAVTGASTGEPPIPPAVIEAEKALAPQAVPPRPVEAAPAATEPASPSATEAASPAPAAEPSAPPPASRKGKRRKNGSGRVEMSPQ